jgi:hypothetical protein
MPPTCDCHSLVCGAVSLNNLGIERSDIFTGDIAGGY